MPSEDHLPGAATLIKIPEIFIHMCDSLETPDCVSLLRTCRSFFPIAASRIWENVHDARPLLALIGATSTPPGIGNRRHEEIYINRGSSFQRLDVYAPFVKHLNVCGKTSQNFEIKNWRPIFLRAQKQPLLPNLLSLTTQAGKPPFGSDQLLWISAFASPSLEQFTAAFSGDCNEYRTSNITSSVILKTLIDRCPHILSLGLYPDREDGEWDEDGESSFLNLLCPSPFLEYLQSLVSLREISTSLYLINEGGLLVLGKLPQLEHLIIHGCNSSLEDPQFSIPFDSFPRLTHLVLEKIYVAVVEDLMGVEPLANGLTSVSICHWFEEQDEDERRDWFASIFPRHLQHTACLKHFSYDATYEASPLNQNLLLLYPIPDEFLRRSSALKMETISLNGFHLGEIGTLSEVCAAWSTLTILRLVHAEVTVEELSCFASLPNLEWLGLVIPFSKPNYGPWPIFDGHVTGLRLHTLEITTTQFWEDPPIDANPVARSLLSLWPNLGSVVWPILDMPPSHRAHVRHAANLLDSLNKLIQAPRELLVQESPDSVMSGV